MVLVLEHLRLDLAPAVQPAVSACIDHNPYMCNPYRLTHDTEQGVLLLLLLIASPVKRAARTAQRERERERES